MKPDSGGDLLSVLAGGPRRYVGTGVNHEGEPFHGALEICSLAAGHGVMLRYVATRADGVAVHREDTVLGRDADGRLCLWPVMEELPCVLPHVQQDIETSSETGVRVVFACGARQDRGRFREEITLAVDASGTLVYAHAWGMPGGEFASRSSCTFLPAGSAGWEAAVVEGDAPGRFDA